MPELPEVESARQVIERWALDRRIAHVDDVDPYVCRPFTTDQFRAALVGQRLIEAHRQGKTMWMPTSGAHVLGCHLGMGGRVVTTGPDGNLAEGGDSTHGLAGAYRPGWDRLSLRFDDGTAFHLVDKRRLGRAVLDPDLSILGPDALVVSPAEFDLRVPPSRAPIKARLMDQRVIAGVGNLIADELLWRAMINPTRPAHELTPADARRVYRCMRQALTYAIKHGGSHAGHLIAHRHADGRCPRCRAALRYVRVGGRSTWFCSREQCV